MKVFDLSQLKKTTRQKQPVQQLQNTRSYSEIHKSPTKSSIRQPLQQSFYLSRWGKNIDGKNKSQPWTNVGQGIISTSVGEEHVLIVNNKYQCFGYGGNMYGQLALDTEHVHRPTQLQLFKDMKIVQIATGAYHSFVMNSKGEIYGFGLNIKGQLGIGSFENRKKPSLIYSLLPGGSKNPKSNFFIQTSEYKKKMKKSKQQSNQLSNITNLMQKLSGTQNSSSSGSIVNSKAPTFLLQSDQSIRLMCCGPLHSLMLSSKNRVFACGFGQKHSLGIGKSKTFNEFIQVRIKGTVNKIDKIACGINMSGFLAQGKVYVAGTLGDRTFEVFMALAFGEEVVDFVLGHDQLTVLTRKGDVYYTSKTEGFQRLEGFDSQVKQIFGGLTCCFAISDIGVFYGWGDNYNNQITGIPGQSYIQSPCALKIPIYLQQQIQVLCSNGTTFLLSGKPLQSAPSPSLLNQQIVDQFQSPVLKSSVSQLQIQPLRKSTTKYSHSNIYKTQQRNLLTEMGIKPRTFTISMEIQFAELVVESQISEGGYGIIYKGLWRETTVAIKMFKIQSENGVKDFFSQCAAMQALRHPNIVMFLGACTKPPNFAIVLQYCGRGSLWSTIQNMDIPLTWQDRRRFASQTAKGVNYLHTSTPPIIHRDLKSLNLLLDDSCKVKLADFGWTKGLDNYMTGKIGTYQWMAPEVIASQKYSQKADVFSYGIILWQIASREPPFKNLSGLQVSMEVLNNDLRPKIPKNTPECFVRLMKKCWDRQPSKRPSFKEIIKELQAMKF